MSQQVTILLPPHLPDSEYHERLAKLIVARGGMPKQGPLSLAKEVTAFIHTAPTAGVDISSYRLPILTLVVMDDVDMAVVPFGHRVLGQGEHDDWKLFLGEALPMHNELPVLPPKETTMSTENKYPYLSNKDLAQLIGLNRLIQFDQLPQRFKDMDKYIPYGHDLITLIQERLCNADEATEDVEIDSKRRWCTMTLNYYFERNISLRDTIRDMITEYRVTVPGSLEETITSIVDKIDELGLIAKNVPNGPKFELAVSWDVDHIRFKGEVLARSHIDSWIIYIPQSDPQPLSITPSDEPFSVYLRDWEQLNDAALRVVPQIYWGRKGEIIGEIGVVKVDLTSLASPGIINILGVYFESIKQQFHVYCRRVDGQCQVYVNSAMGNYTNVTYTVESMPR